jgi:predicted RNA-binding Zn-ribbon protein involved in translation (DUF1610 family)
MLRTVYPSCHQFHLLLNGRGQYKVLPLAAFCFERLFVFKVTYRPLPSSSGLTATQKGLEDELLTKSKEAIELRAQLEDTGRKLKNAQTTISKLKKEGLTEEAPPTPVQTVPASDLTSNPPEKKEEAKPHLVKAWFPRFCPDKDCELSKQRGTHENPSFKDETKCTDCGLHLGAEENVKQNLAACPNCGGTKYDVMRK